MELLQAIGQISAQPASMDDTFKRAILGMLQHAVDGLEGAIDASVGKIETGAETRDRYEARMNTTIERIRQVKNILINPSLVSNNEEFWKEVASRSTSVKQMRKALDQKRF